MRAGREQRGARVDVEFAADHHLERVERSGVGDAPSCDFHGRLAELLLKGAGLRPASVHHDHARAAGRDSRDISCDRVEACAFNGVAPELNDDHG